MTDTQASHITVTHEERGTEITCIYAISEDVRREMEAWSSKKNPTNRDVLVWLVNKGCGLDSANGPAYVQRDADGSTVEQYYRDGKLHRDDGPAIICHNPGGTTVERYYQNGAFVKVEYRRAPDSSVSARTLGKPSTPRPA
jgi:hypothetical protein